MLLYRCCSLFSRHKISHLIGHVLMYELLPCNLECHLEFMTMKIAKIEIEAIVYWNNSFFCA